MGGLQHEMATTNFTNDYYSINKVIDDKFYQ